MSVFDDDGPAVRSPELAALVDLAARQRPAASRLRTDDIVRASRQRGSQRTRRAVIVAVAAAAGIALVWIGLQRFRAQGVDERARDEAVFDRASSGGAREVEASRGVPEQAGRAPDEVPRDEIEPPQDVSTAVPSPVEDAPLDPPVTADPPAESPKPPRADADALAAAAERAMAERRTRDAIGLLETIVRSFSEHPATKTALLDLGRLRRAAGQPDHARCAYAAFRKRWPSDPMKGEVDKALAALGDGAACRGLRPVR